MVTAVWGWTFVLVKDALTHYPTLPFLQLRFILAFLVMVALVRRLPTRREVKVGAIAGAVLAAGYLTQTVGLTMTSPGNSGLITGLFVVFTPVIDRVFGVPLRWFTLTAVAIALAGTVLLVGGPSGFGLGDLLTVACAALYALHIVLLSHWSPALRGDLQRGRIVVANGSCPRRLARDRRHRRLRVRARFLHPDLGAAAPEREPHRSHPHHRTRLGGGSRGRAGGAAIRPAAGNRRRTDARGDRGP